MTTWTRLVGQSETEKAIIADLVAAEQQRDVLRAVLAPLLDEPFESWDDASGYTHIDCRFCKGYRRASGNEVHDPDCPVLRRDELLGR